MDARTGYFSKRLLIRKADVKGQTACGRRKHDAMRATIKKEEDCMRAKPKESRREIVISILHLSN